MLLHYWTVSQLHTLLGEPGILNSRTAGATARHVGSAGSWTHLQSQLILTRHVPYCGVIPRLLVWSFISELVSNVFELKSLMHIHCLGMKCYWKQNWCFLPTWDTPLELDHRHSQWRRTLPVFSHLDCLGHSLEGWGVGRALSSSEGWRGSGAGAPGLVCEPEAPSQCRECGVSLWPGTSSQWSLFLSALTLWGLIAAALLPLSMHNGDEYI